VKKTALLALSLMVAGPALSVADAAQTVRRGDRRSKKVRVVPPTPELIGTVTYDTGTNAGFFPDAPTSAPNQNRNVGNRFNSALGGPLLMTGMLSMLTVFPASAGYQSVSVGDTPVGANAYILYFLNVPMQAGQFNQVTFSPAVDVMADFVGFFLGAFGANNPVGLLGMSDMQTMGQGYHAVAGYYAAGSATMLATVPNRNAMMRATGDILVPVELMDFKIQ
jgi:hypothetical protein